MKFSSSLPLYNLSLLSYLICVRFSPTSSRDTSSIQHVLPIQLRLTHLYIPLSSHYIQLVTPPKPYLPRVYHYIKNFFFEQPTSISLPLNLTSTKLSLFYDNICHQHYHVSFILTKILHPFPGTSHSSYCLPSTHFTWILSISLIITAPPPPNNLNHAKLPTHPSKLAFNPTRTHSIRLGFVTP